jgi:glycosyltransferase involved in cell wall biosynthesis
LRILHIATSLEGGAGIGARRYHEALVQAGVDSRILVAGNSSSLTGERVQGVQRSCPSGFARLSRALGWKTDEMRMAQRVAQADAAAGNAAQYELFSLPFSSYPVEEHPWVQEADQIYIHWVAGFLDWPCFFKRVSRPVVLVLHDQQNYLGGFHYQRDAERNPHLAHLEEVVREIKKRALNGQCVKVIANSEWNATAARASGFFAKDVPIECVYYPLDKKVFQPRPREAAKQAFGIDPARKVVGFACADLDNERKGFAELLDALALLPEETRRGLTLLSFGRAPKESSRIKVGLPWVHLGHLDAEEAQVGAYSAMDVFVVPSKAEAFGLAAQEALACGCRVVATQIGGLPEALKEFGYFSKNEDPEEVSRTLKTALEKKPTKN